MTGWTAMPALFYVGIGGFAGAVLRYLVSGWTQQLWHVAGFPLGTLTVNLLGCLVLGSLAGWSFRTEGISPSIRLFLMVGLLGSFTTFSTFSYETVALFQDGETVLGLVNSLGQVVAGVLLAWLGYSLATAL